METQPPPPPSAPQPSVPPPPPPRSKWKSRIKWIVIIGGGLVVILAAASPLIIRAIIQHEIQATVAADLNAKLVIDDLAYHPFLGLTIRDAHLTTTAPDGSTVPVADLHDLDVSLAKLPFGGPIVVDDFTITDPTIQLVRLPSGEYQVQGNFLRPSQPSPPSSTPFKMSSVIQIHHFAITNMVVEESDLGSGRQRLWGRMDLDVTSTDPADYSFTLRINNPQIGTISLDGTGNADEYGVNLVKTSFRVEGPRANRLNQMPPELAAFCKLYDLSGQGVNVTLADKAALKIDLGSGHWTLRGFNGQVALTSRNRTQSGTIQFAASGGGAIAPAPGQSYLSSLDPDTSLSLTVDPNSPLQIRSHTLPQPLNKVVGAVEVSNSSVNLKGISIDYGGHPIQLDSSAQLKGDELTVKGLHLDAAGGAVLVDSAQIKTVAPYDYSAQVDYEGIDLRQAKDLLQISDPEGHISGTAHGTVQANGSMPPGEPMLQGLRADGKLHIENGDFYDIPVLRDVSEKVVPGLAGTGRIGEAAAVYHVGDSTINFSKLAVSCPAIGIQGSGTVGLTGDNTLNLNLIVAPLGDLKKQLQKTGIPILGQLAGSVQNAFNNASAKLYSFNVTGPAASPSISAGASPELSAGAKNVFGEMLKTTQGGLMDVIQATQNATNGNK